MQTALDTATLNGSTIDIAGMGSAAVLDLIGDTAITYANPTVDAAGLIASRVAGQTGAVATVVNAVGRFVNQGTVLADGPAGSTFTLNVQQSGSGTAIAPGYFFNAGHDSSPMPGIRWSLMSVLTSEVLNGGFIIADGGYCEGHRWASRHHRRFRTGSGIRADRGRRHV